MVVAPDPPRDDTRYVGYAETDLVSTAAYRIGMAGALPVFFAMLVDGRATPNLLDGLRLRAGGVVRTGLLGSFGSTGVRSSTPSAVAPDRTRPA